MDYPCSSGTACALLDLTKQFVMRLGILVPVLAVAITGNIYSAVTLPMRTVFKGQDRFQQLVVRAKAEDWKSLPIGERTATVGQAMVGTIEPARDRSLPGREELHAKQITHAPESPLQSLDQAQDAVPVACDEERPLPNARRKISGGTEGQQECLEARPLYRQGNR